MNKRRSKHCSIPFARAIHYKALDVFVPFFVHYPLFSRENLFPSCGDKVRLIIQVLIVVLVSQIGLSMLIIYWQLEIGLLMLVIAQQQVYSMYLEYVFVYLYFHEFHIIC